MGESPGQRLRFLALYFSGAGVANASFGLPDLGITTLNDVLEDARRITSASELPLIVDADTGWGGAFNIARTVNEMIRAGAAAIHIEDQVASKRCGQRPGKKLAGPKEMTDRIKAALDARTDAGFMVIARTDARAGEGSGAAMNRAALEVYRAIRAKGTQKDVTGLMQTREELYEFPHYYDYERKLDSLYPAEDTSGL